MKAVWRMRALWAVLCSGRLWLTSSALPMRTHKWKMISQGYPRSSFCSQQSFSLVVLKCRSAGRRVRAWQTLSDCLRSLLCVFSLRSHSPRRAVSFSHTVCAYFCLLFSLPHFFLFIILWVHLYHSPHFLLIEQIVTLLHRSGELSEFRWWIACSHLF